MALVAKEPLFAGGICFANTGSVVSPAAVEQYGWQDKVEEVGGDGTSAAVPTPKVTPIPLDEVPVTGTAVDGAPATADPAKPKGK